MMMEGFVVCRIDGSSEEENCAHMRRLPGRDVAYVLASLVDCSASVLFVLAGTHRFLKLSTTKHDRDTPHFVGYDYIF
jgi:hypothetical protein